MPTHKVAMRKLQQLRQEVEREDSAAEAQIVQLVKLRRRVQATLQQVDEEISKESSNAR